MPWYVVLFWLSVPSLLLAAWRWGAWPEKAGASIHAIGVLASILVRPAWAVRFASVDTPMLVVDVLVLVAFLYLALRADRWWPLCATALQIVSVLGHLARAMNPNFWRAPYALMESLPAYAIVAILAIGIWRQRRRAMNMHRGSSKGFWGETDRTGAR